MKYTPIERLVLESFHQIRPDAEVSFAHVYGFTYVVLKKNSGISEKDLNKVSHIILAKTKDWAERYSLLFSKAPSGAWIITIKKS